MIGGGEIWIMLNEHVTCFGTWTSVSGNNRKAIPLKHDSARHSEKGCPKLGQRRPAASAPRVCVTSVPWQVVSERTQGSGDLCHCRMPNENVTTILQSVSQKWPSSVKWGLLASIGLFVWHHAPLVFKDFQSAKQVGEPKKKKWTFSRKCFVPTITRSNLIWPPLIHQAVKNLLNFIWNQMNFDNFDNERLQFLHGINLFYKKFVSLSHWCSFSPLVM